MIARIEARAREARAFAERSKREADERRRIEDAEREAGRVKSANSKFVQLERREKGARLSLTMGTTFAVIAFAFSYGAEGFYYPAFLADWPPAFRVVLHTAMGIVVGIPVGLVGSLAARCTEPGFGSGCLGAIGSACTMIILLGLIALLGNNPFWPSILFAFIFGSVVGFISGLINAWILDFYS